MTVSIAIDAMGGDKAPREIVRGAVIAAQERDGIELLLVGREDDVKRELELTGFNGSNISCVPAENVIEMSDSPVEALSKKRGSSIEIATRLIREGKAQAVVSAGNTGACVAAGSLLLGRLKAVRRPGIAVVFHTSRNPVVVIDVGANVHPKPEHLLQYAIMASTYASEILGIESPRVGLLNVGAENEKGSALAKTTYGLLQETSLNFVGNIEGADIFSGSVEVTICDGFVGNIVLKVSEGLAETLKNLVLGAIEEGLSSLANSAEIGASLKGALATLERKIDYSEYGGAPLLGLDGNVIICHGKSDAKAIDNAIGVAQRMASSDLNAHITEALQN